MFDIFFRNNMNVFITPIQREWKKVKSNRKGSTISKKAIGRGIDRQVQRLK